MKLPMAHSRQKASVTGWRERGMAPSIPMLFCFIDNGKLASGGTEFIAVSVSHLCLPHFSVPPEPETPLIALLVLPA